MKDGNVGVDSSRTKVGSDLLKRKILDRVTMHVALVVGGSVL